MAEEEDVIWFDVIRWPNVRTEGISRGVFKICVQPSSPPLSGFPLSNSLLSAPIGEEKLVKTSQMVKISGRLQVSIHLL